MKFVHKVESTQTDRQTGPVSGRYMKIVGHNNEVIEHPAELVMTWVTIRSYNTSLWAYFAIQQPPRPT